MTTPRLFAAAIALAWLANGAWMLVTPALWYDSVPGVPDTGAFNVHFVRDISFAFMLSGAACARAALRPQQFAAWLALGTAWPAAHALFHLAEWVLHGLPRADVVAAELVAVQLPVALAAGLAWFASRRHALQPAPVGQPS